MRGDRHRQCNNRMRNMCVHHFVWGMVCVQTIVCGIKDAPLLRRCNTIAMPLFNPVFNNQVIWYHFAINGYFMRFDLFICTLCVFTGNKCALGWGAHGTRGVTQIRIYGQIQNSRKLKCKPLYMHTAPHTYKLWPETTKQYWCNNYVTIEIAYT